MIWTGLIEAVFPPACCACGAVGREPFCRVCHEALIEYGDFELEGLAGAAALFEYGGPIAEALHALKYRRRPDIGGALTPRIEAAIDSPVELVVPVPLSKARLRARGYNQSSELCRGIAHVDDRCLQRVRDTAPQVGLSLHARHRNVGDAFAVIRPESVQGRRVLLIDDVVTTGATMKSAAAALFTAGAADVVALAVARRGLEG